jgi:hypothetical protein
MGLGEATQNVKIMDPLVADLVSIAGQKPVVGLPPRFPVKTLGVDELHAALFTESRTRGPC